MKLASLSLVTLASASWSIVNGLSSSSSSRWQCPPSSPFSHQFSTPICQPSPSFHFPPRRSASTKYSNARIKTSTSLYATIEEGESPASTLLQMVDTIAKCESSSDQIQKMEELEKILTKLVETQKAAQQQQEQEPRPPEMPPPMQALADSTAAANDLNLQKAESALAQLRERLAREEENLVQAEKALRKSKEEAEIIRRAEKELQEKKKSAEQRMAEAIRRTKTFVESTEEARKKLLKQQQQQAASSKTQAKKDTAQRTNHRPTIALEQFFATGGAGNNKQGGRGAIFNAELPPGEKTDVIPLYVPTLYNWKLNSDGSVTGSVKGSTSFREGAIITTSRLAVRCEGGTLVKTSSGSMYYLQLLQSSTSAPAPAPPVVPHTARSKDDQAKKLAAEQKIREAEERREAARLAREISRRQAEEEAKEKIAAAQRPRPSSSSVASFTSIAGEMSIGGQMLKQAPDGVPSILSWTQREDGGISGQVFGSPGADDGDYIETSPIAGGTVDNGFLVVTSSGSRYFLSPEEADKNANISAALKDIAKARTSKTITITKKRTEKEQVQAALEKLQEGKSRATFSLSDFGLGFLADNNKNNNNRQQEQTTPAASSNDLVQQIAQNAPEGVPILARWNANTDGSITGEVYGSQFIGDGDLVTTSPIARGTKKQFETVTTVSGSMYYLA